ncbi:hypothetical protein CALCODRAFT_233178 [Calocera cornea HHB12733]|uniref:Zn(2)-C6 fungal-type domain-containing protein n=1 Tax=Calocera cornea HHB12733 TaxID=1353952 RepID=A0A165GW94_9BASI|nr:hypothetical protein CALCODRAFT_233178 [Calocera cornea HHB12733]
MDPSLKRRALSPPPREPAPLRRRLAPLDISDNDHRALDELVMLRLDRYRAAQSFDAIKTLVALVKTCADLDGSLTDMDAASRILDEREELEMLLMVGWEGREFKHVRNHPALRRKPSEREYSEVPSPPSSASAPLPLTPPPQSVQARWESEASVDQGPLPPLALPRSPDDQKPRPMEEYNHAHAHAHALSLPPSAHAHHAHLPVQGHPHAQPDIREAQYYGPRLESEEPGPSRPKWSALPERACSDFPSVGRLLTSADSDPSYHDEIDELEEDDAHMVYPSSYPMPAPNSAYAGPNRRRSYVPTSARAAQLEERASRSTGIVKVADARCKRCIARGIAECTIYKSTRTPNNGRVACHMCQKMKVKCEWERNPNETLSTAVRDVPPGIALSLEQRDRDLGPGPMDLRDELPIDQPAPLGSQGQGYDSKPNRIWERDYEPRAVLLPEQEVGYPGSGSASASASSFSTEGTPSLPYDGEDMKLPGGMVVPPPPMAQVQAPGLGQGPVDPNSSPMQKAQKQRRAPKPPMTQVIRRVAVIKKKKWDKCTISTTAMKACQACHRMKQRCQWSLSSGVGADKGMTEEVKMELEEPVYAPYQPEDQVDSPDDTHSGSQGNVYAQPDQYDDGAGYAPPDDRYEPANAYAAPDNYAPSNSYSQPPGLGLSAPEPYPHSIASNQSYERGDTSTYTPHSRMLPLKESYERGRDPAPMHPRLPSNESYERGDTTLYSHSGARDAGSGSGGYARSESASYSDGISRPASSGRPPVMEQYPPKGMDALLEPRPVSRQESNVSSSLSTPVSSLGSQRVDEGVDRDRDRGGMVRRDEAQAQAWAQVD